jgi:hypothetical protein
VQRNIFLMKRSGPLSFTRRAAWPACAKVLAPLDCTPALARLSA